MTFLVLSYKVYKIKKQLSCFSFFLKIILEYHDPLTAIVSLTTQSYQLNVSGSPHYVLFRLLSLLMTVQLLCLEIRSDNCGNSRRCVYNGH